jgi:hypothetical protein
MSTAYDVTVTWKGQQAHVRVDVATFGHPGSFNPYDGGSPPEGPEAEVLALAVETSSGPIGVLLDDLTETEMDELVETEMDELVDLAIAAAADQREGIDPFASAILDDEMPAPPACDFCDGVGCNGCAKGHTEAGTR